MKPKTYKQMRKLITVFSLALFLFSAVTACQQSKDKSEQTESAHEMDSAEHEQMAKVQYTCTMHPEVVRDEPGKCPKCGMELVKKEVDQPREGDEK